MKQLITLYKSKLPHRVAKVMYSYILDKYIIITIINGKLKEEETVDTKYVLDFIKFFNIR